MMIEKAKRTQSEERRTERTEGPTAHLERFAVVLLILAWLFLSTGCGERQHPSSPSWAAALDYTANETHRVGPRAFVNLDSLLERHQLRGKRFTLDYANRVFASSDEELPEALPQSASVLDIVSSGDLDENIFVHGEVYGRPGLIHIDPGKDRCAVDPGFADELGLIETAKGYMVTDVQLGRFSFSVGFAGKQDLAELDPDLPEPVIMAVGSDVLSQILMTVDFRSCELILMEPSQEPQDG